MRTFAHDRRSLTFPAAGNKDSTLPSLRLPSLFLPPGLLLVAISAQTGNRFGAFTGASVYPMSSDPSMSLEERRQLALTVARIMVSAPPGVKGRGQWISIEKRDSKHDDDRKLFSPRGHEPGNSTVEDYMRIVRPLGVRS